MTQRAGLRDVRPARIISSANRLLFTAINNFPADIVLLSLMDYKNHDGFERCLRQLGQTVSRSVDASYIAAITADLRLEKKILSIACKQHM